MKKDNRLRLTSLNNQELHNVKGGEVYMCYSCGSGSITCVCGCDTLVAAFYGESTITSGTGTGGLISYSRSSAHLNDIEKETR